MRASYPVQQRQQKAWKAMFYTLVGVIVVKSYLLSSHSYVADKAKFTEHLAFRETLYKGLFAHARPQVVVSNTDIIGHQRVSFKRSPCVVCKHAAEVERRGIKRARRLVLQVISPNVASKKKNRHVHRAKMGCSFCNVALCTERSTRRCWDIWHSGAPLA